jgi:hypothetical protein
MPGRGRKEVKSGHKNSSLVYIPDIVRDGNITLAFCPRFSISIINFQKED